MSEKIKPKDLFYTSWGYDQTNYDYIIVLELSPSGKTAICQRASCDVVGYSSQCNIQKPVAEGFGDKVRLKIVKQYDGSVRLRGSYPFCHDGTGSKRLGGFSKHEKDDTYSETDPMFGH